MLYSVPQIPDYWEVLESYSQITWECISVTSAWLEPSEGIWENQWNCWKLQCSLEFTSNLLYIVWKMGSDSLLVCHFDSTPERKEECHRGTIEKTRLPDWPGELNVKPTGHHCGDNYHPIISEPSIRCQGSVAAWPFCNEGTININRYFIYTRHSIEINSAWANSRLEDICPCGSPEYCNEVL